MLYDMPIATSAGVGTNVQANIGQMSNKGWEISLDYKNQFGDFGVNVGINIGTNKNKLISLTDDAAASLFITAGSTTQGGESGGVGMTGTPTRSEPGRPLGLFYGLKTNGIFQTDAEAAAAGYVVATVSATSPHTPRAGDLRFIDLNGDGRITTDDFTFIGNPWPKFTHGLTLGANWKKLIDIKAVFGGTYGNDIFNFVAPLQHNFFSDYSTSPMIFDVSFFQLFFGVGE